MEHDTGCQMSSYILFTALSQEIIRYDKCLVCYTRVESEKRNNCINIFVHVQFLLLVPNF